MVAREWVPSAETDLELLAWAMPFMSPKALDPAPATVGPGHNGASAAPPGRPTAVDNRARDFSRAMEVHRRLKATPLRHPSGLLCRVQWCEHCANREPWKALSRTEIQTVLMLGGSDVPGLPATEPATLADVLWLAYGIHGKGLTSASVFAHVGWQFATDYRRAKWAGIKSVGVRAQKMSVFGGHIVGVASNIYADFRTMEREYARLEDILQGADPSL